MCSVDLRPLGWVERMDRRNFGYYPLFGAFFRALAQPTEPQGPSVGHFSRQALASGFFFRSGRFD
jgi:hypothetical protein